MFSSFSLPFSIPTFGFSNERKPVDLPSVKIHDLETASDQATKRLQSLLKLNHTNHSIIYHNLQFHNHAPHVRRSIMAD